VEEVKITVTDKSVESTAKLKTGGQMYDVLELKPTLENLDIPSMVQDVHDAWIEAAAAQMQHFLLPYDLMRLSFQDSYLHMVLQAAGLQLSPSVRTDRLGTTDAVVSMCRYSHPVLCMRTKSDQMPSIPAEHLGARPDGHESIYSCNHLLPALNLALRLGCRFHMQVFPGLYSAVLTTYSCTQKVPYACVFLLEEGWSTLPLRI
jgi:hypothetical protein